MKIFDEFILKFIVNIFKIAFSKIQVNLISFFHDFQNFGKKLYATSKEMGISLINLGKGKPYNMITNISEEYE